MEDAMWVVITAVLALAAVLLGVLLWRLQRDSQDLREERDAALAERDGAVAARKKAIGERKRAELAAAEATQAAQTARAEAADPDDDEQRRKYVRAAQEAVNGTVRRMQGLGNDAAERIQSVLHTYGADVLADLMPVDHVVAQMQRRLQVLAVLCGSWPGQQRSPAELADIVRSAQSRIHDYSRVRMSLPDEKTAVVGRAVEPVGMALAELLDNATRSSPPSTPVDVVFETDYHGVSILVVDGGVGMAPEEVRRAVGLLQWGQHEVDLTELGNPPRTGFAVCGVLAARYGFRVGLDTGSPRGGLRATLFLPSALLTTVDPTEEARSIEPARESVREQRVHDREEERDPILEAARSAYREAYGDESEREPVTSGTHSWSKSDSWSVSDSWSTVDDWSKRDDWSKPDHEPVATTSGGLPKRRRASRTGSTGRTGELPAISDAPSPTPRHANPTYESTLATETAASNMRAFQNGSRMASEARTAHDD